MNQNVKNGWGLVMFKKFKEIEKRFLVSDKRLIPSGSISMIEQVYLYGLRFRRSNKVNAKNKYFLTYKGKGTLSRTEIEFRIPKVVYDFAAKRTNVKITKMRTTVPHGKHKIEFDTFIYPNRGLVIAEVELSCDNEVILPFPSAYGIGAEITNDKLYSNYAMAKAGAKYNGG